MRCFQYKALNNILFLNNKLYTSKLANNLFYSFCKHENETTMHIFHFCNSTRRLMSQLKLLLEPDLLIPYLLPHTAIFSFLDEPNNQNFVYLNHLLLLFKLNIHNSRNVTVLCFNKLLRDITKVKEMEKSFLENPW